MSDDDDTDCPAHDWRLLGATLDYQCDSCDAVMITTPDGHPPTRR